MREDEFPVVINQHGLSSAIHGDSEINEKRKHWKVLIARTSDASCKDHDDNLIGFLELQLEDATSKNCFFVMAIRRTHQKQGIGTKLLTRAKEMVDELHSWVIVNDGHQKRDGTDYQSPLSFYLKNGFELGLFRRVDEKNLDVQEVIWKK